MNTVDHAFSASMFRVHELDIYFIAYLLKYTRILVDRLDQKLKLLKVTAKRIGETYIVSSSKSKFYCRFFVNLCVFIFRTGT